MTTVSAALGPGVDCKWLRKWFLLVNSTYRAYYIIKDDKKCENIWQKNRPKYDQIQVRTIHEVDVLGDFGLKPGVRTIHVCALYMRKDGIF